MPRKSTTKTKLALIAVFGGACQRCGYSRCRRALHFHHSDPSEKYEWTSTGHAAPAEVQAHPDRFILLCANCHAEVHDELDQARQIYAACPVCGNDFPVSPLRVQNGRDRFCSTACLARGRYLIAKPLAERFWKHVEKTDTCWLWTGYRDPQGRGRIKLYAGQAVLATRAAWELDHGPIPPNKVLLHCENPACVRPEHMQLGTRSEASQRTYDTGRRNRGERHGHAKLTEQHVREIRARYAAGNISQKALGHEYGISQGAVRDVIVRATWKHLD